jgi:hypothetical protein
MSGKNSGKRGRPQYLKPFKSWTVWEPCWVSYKMRVENNEKTTTRRLRGGVTGKGFEPGRSGNPGGRPKGTLLDKTLVELLQADGGRHSRAIAEKLIAKAKRGDVRAARLIAEPTEGRPKQKIDMNIGGRIDGSLDLSLLSDSELEARLIKLLAESPELLQEASRDVTSEKTR